MQEMKCLDSKKTMRISRNHHPLAASIWLHMWHLVAGLLIMGNAQASKAQGIVTFDQPGVTNGIGYSSLWYHGGMSFKVGNRTWPYDSIAHVGVGLEGHPNNATPHLEYVNTLGIPQYVVFTLTNDNSFGLVSVDLADSVAPSLTPVGIVFNGFKADGSIVSQTFTVGGGGSTTFETFQFNPEFAFGLTRVEIPSPAWAMDNLVWVPEPSALSMFFVGVGALAFRQRRRKLTAI